MPRKAKPRRRLPVVYRGVSPPIEYVDKSPFELRAELQRVYAAIATASKLFERLARFRHPAIPAARFQLANAIRETSGMDDEALANELARLNYTMEDTVRILSLMSLCEQEWLEKIRFELTFGQTPRKRELVGNTKDKNYEYTQEEAGDDFTDA